MKPFIGAVCVAYHPDAAGLLKVVKQAQEQVDCLVVVNNGEQPLSEILPALDAQAAQRINIIENGDNLGIAAALNVGIRFLCGRPCTHLLLLDQDSILPPGMVAALLRTLQEQEASGAKVAAVGPCFFNTNLGKAAPFVQFSNRGIKKLYGSEAMPVIPVHHLITSGSLLPAQAIEDIGLMEEELFIDMVDTEWCFRALSKGYLLYGDSRIIMNHALGDTPVTFMKKKFIEHSPLRHYYAARNLMHLLGRAYIPLKWRLGLSYSLFKAFVFYSLIPRDRFRHFTHIAIGIRHGMAGKYGRIDRLFQR
ncbi:MAG: glycosyltransferase family 2 protein [Methylococcales bacterium]|nr:glycosyltransferase family 2 protein [Methylococcales bacterium]